MSACQWCEELVEEGEQSPAIDSPMHTECALRSVVGSVAHLSRRCVCYQKGSTLEDPPAFTRRESARAAAHLWHLMETWFGEDAWR